jgi:hypothetical protein
MEEKTENQQLLRYLKALGLSSGDSIALPRFLKKLHAGPATEELLRAGWVLCSPALRFRLEEEGESCDLGECPLPQAETPAATLVRLALESEDHRGDADAVWAGWLKPLVAERKARQEPAPGLLSEADLADVLDPRTVMEMLIDRHGDAEFSDLDPALIRLVWKVKGSRSGGGLIAGKARKLPDLRRLELPPIGDANEPPVFEVELSLDAWIAHSDLEREVVVYHELCHFDVSDPDKPKTRRHDLETFVAEAERYGAWRRELAQVAAATVNHPEWPAQARHFEVDARGQGLLFGGRLGASVTRISVSDAGLVQ